MPKPKGTHWVITAGFTDDGGPAFLRRDGKWSRNLQEAWPIEGDAQKDEQLAAALRQEVEVCDPYAYQVSLTPQGIDPLSAKEGIRANGPSVSYRRPDPANVSAR
jgi:hypothetical protein